MQSNAVSQAQPEPMSDVVETTRHDVQGVDTGVVSPEILLTPQDTEALAVFDEVKQLSTQLSERLAGVEQALRNSQASSGLTELVRQLRNEVNTKLNPLCEKIFRHDVQSLQQIYDLRVHMNHILRELSYANDRFNEVRSSKLYQSARSVVHGATQAKSLAYRAARKAKRMAMGSPVPQAPIAEAPSANGVVNGEKIRNMQEEHTFYALHNPYADVDNRNTAFEIFRNWVTIFHVNGKRFGASSPLVNDQLPTIYELNHIYPLAGKTVLELGPLEAGNTKQMVDLGAKFVVGIESNRESFLKCLIAKNDIPLDNTRFIFGDLNHVLTQPEFSSGPKYDLCLASGLLYHMEDPLLTIDLITQTASTIYVWSHVASDRAPAGEWLDVTDRAGRTYRGRRNEYKKTDVLGGVGACAIWLTPENLRKAFEDRGFSVQDMGTLQNYKGDAIKFLATKR